MLCGPPILESWWGWKWESGLLKMQISGPYSRPTEAERWWGWRPGTSTQWFSCLPSLRSADLILNILQTSSLIVTEKNACWTLSSVVGITKLKVFTLEGLWGETNMKTNTHVPMFTLLEMSLLPPQHASLLNSFPVILKTQSPYFLLLAPPRVELIISFWGHYLDSLLNI